MKIKVAVPHSLETELTLFQRIMPMSCDHVIGIIYFDYLAPTIAGLLAISMIPPIFIYFRAYQKKKIMALKSFFYLGALLFIIIFIEFISMIPYTINLCHDIKDALIFSIICSQAYVYQNLILIGWFFYRLEYIFRATSLALSKSIIISFVVIYTLFCLFSIISGILWKLGVSSSLFVTAVFFMVLFTILLVVVFIYKLFKIFKTNEDEDLLKVMRKASFLVFISTSLIIFTASLGSVVHIVNSIHLYVIHSLVGIMDLYSSFLCVLFSLKYFNGYYTKVCGLCESKCYAICCKKYVVSEQIKSMSKNKDSINIELSIDTKE